MWRVLWIVGVCACICGFHFIGSRNARHATVAPGNGPLPETGYYDAPPEVQRALETEKRVVPALALVPGYTGDGSARMFGLHRIVCHGGPNDGRYVLLPVDPAESLKLPSMKVMAVSFGSFVHAGTAVANASDANEASPLLVPQGSARFVTLRQDKTRLTVTAIAVYDLEQHDGVARLAFEGTVSLAEYGRFLRVPPHGTEFGKVAPTDSLEIETGKNSLRTLEVFQTKCVGGPADGKTCPLLVRPAVLFEAGLAGVMVTELDFRPKEIGFTTAVKPQPASAFVGTSSLYALEAEKQPSGFRNFKLSFVASLDAEEQIGLHNPNGEGKR